LDAPVNTFFASFPSGVVKTGDAKSDDDGDDVTTVAVEPVGQKGRPVGRIKERLDFWVEHFCPDANVRGVLDHGYKAPIDWEKIPEAYEEADNKSARENYDFVQEEVARLMESGQVVKCAEKPRCCNPLTVAVKHKDNGELKQRLALYLSRCVNLAINDDDNCMTTLQDAINSTRKGDFQVVFDLKLAFHHIRLHTSMYELMEFKVTDKDGVVT
jgi:uncharacterized protein YeaO (DUF488 family)